MSLTGLDVFDRTVHTTNRWLQDLMGLLPMLVRGFYYEGWDPTGKPVRERSLEGFLKGVLPTAIRELWPAAPRAA